MRGVGRTLVIAALVLLAAAAVRDLARLGDAAPWRQLYDFSDFYCAGEALDRRADPYRYEPLHRCEHRVNRSEAYRRDPAHAVPAPLPPYDFPPFMLAARLDFPKARALHALAIVLALCACVWGLRLLRVPLEVGTLALLLPAGFVLLAAGQVVPFALVALIFCGVALAGRRYDMAGALAALTMVEPHLGLPVCAALFYAQPRSRRALTVSVAALAAVAIVVSGAGGIAEYLGRVLPAQGAAEAGYAYQYSLTYVLVSSGVPRAPALLAGDVWYAGMTIFGVWLSCRLARALHAPELLALMPAACSIFGGPYVHMVDIAFAMPAAAVLATRLRGGPRRVAIVALCLLAVPWIPAWIVKKLFLASVAVVAALLWRLRSGAGLAAVTLCAVALALYVLELAPPAPLVAIASRTFAPGELAQAAWSDYVAALPPPALTWLLVKVPTWAALAGLLAAAALQLQRPAEVHPA